MSEQIAFAPKKSMTALDLACWLRENKSFLEGSIVKNVHRVKGMEALIFRLHRAKGDLVVEPSARIHWARLAYPRERTLDQFVQGLRKRVRGARLVGAEQLGFDRILALRLSSGSTLVLELLPRGVVAVLDEAGRILHASEYAKMRDRAIERGAEYKPPPGARRAPPTIEECRAAALAEGPARLSRALSLPGELVEEAMFRGGERGICEALRSLFEEAEEGRGYLAASPGGSLVYFAPFRPRRLESAGLEVRVLDSFSEAVEEYFSSLDRARLVELSSREAEREAARLRAALERETESMRRYEREAEEAKSEAELILAAREELERALECVRRTRESSGWSEVVESCLGVKRAEPSRGLVWVDVGGKVLELAVHRSLREQIEERFERYKKLKRKAESAREKLAELERKIREVVERGEVERVEARAAARVRRWYERFNWSFTRRGLLVIAGRNAQQNEAIVRRHLSERDVFLHADVHGAAATVLKLGASEEPSDEDLLDAARIAACYSKAWSAGYAAVDVFWVRGEQVSKSPPSGEYLPRGSFMVYGQRNYVRGVPLELAVGVEELEDWGARYIVGSPDSVAARGRLVALLVPGESPPIDVAEKIAETLRSRGIAHPPPEELALLIPGRSRIKRLLI
ncbi:MAG: ribosome rescue protein RqcH [Fervidicoccaceae archaeon]